MVEIQEELVMCLWVGIIDSLALVSEGGLPGPRPKRGTIARAVPRAGAEVLGGTS